MIQIPSPVLARFEACLTANNVSAALWVHYKKWLRFYLDFCTKYHRDPMDSSSLADFQQKLLDKGQTEMQRKQAAHAVGLHLGNDHASWVQGSSDSPTSPAFNSRDSCLVRRICG